MWTADLTSSQQFTDLLARCICPFWRNMYSVHEHDLLDAQLESLAGRPAVISPAAISNLLSGSHIRLTYEQLQRQAVASFRDMICTQTKDELVQFMAAVTALRYNTSPQSSTSSPLTEGTATPAGSPVRKMISNPSPQKHKPGRSMNFGEVRKTPTKKK